MEFEYNCVVTFRDLDGLGHVNNAVYHSYIEQARCQFFYQIGLWAQPSKEVMSLPIILARSEIDFLKPALLFESILIKIKVTKIGRKSFEMHYDLFAQNSADAQPQPAKIAVSKAVLVWFSHDQGTSLEIPGDAKLILEKYKP